MNSSIGSSVYAPLYPIARASATMIRIVSCMAALIAIPTPAQAQQSGTAMLADGGGRQAGCVRWSYTTEPAGNSNAPNRVRLIFVFRNECQRTVFVRMATQTGQTNAAGYSNGYELAPGETKGGPSKTPTNVIFSPAAHRYLNFWVFQSDRPFNDRNGNMPSLSRCNPGFKPVGPISAFPPCPPSFSHR